MIPERNDIEFEPVDAGASKTVPLQCSALRKGGFVVIKARPCKIVDMSTSKTGKHGHAKVHLVGIDVFTGKKYEILSPSTHNMDVPIVHRKELLVMDVSDDRYLYCMDENGNEVNHLKMPDDPELVKKLDTFMSAEDPNQQKEIYANVLTAMGEEACIDFKEVVKGP
ncbi:eukaryotic translation initiation factor 5A [Metarhizium album ARSEF 1941]|uniref:Eukaryotic translation initiation factor 5A n=1 Tax=Metarhizium album (strain ARSEF 1941) TaxID=1081103 RepID=A0A0B2WYF4_METAS|nr:eukaryotic translation initiation factor 5A [Metarhizium album ARSEF 1941]KHN97880.1 eukaryotic translation initiation factor 5A [Metarhizium album ARSEF 1941]